MNRIHEGRMARRVSRAAGGVALLATLAAPIYTLLLAQDRMPPMAMKDTTSRQRQARQMHDLMGAPLPFGIMIGSAEQWMVGYQGMVTKLDGLLDGRDGVTSQSALTRFPAVPTDMTMQMHMGMVMYAPSARFTMMAMLPYTAMSMGERHRDGTTSSESTSGIGDVVVRGLYSVHSAKSLRQRILVTFGVSVPTGSINQQDPEGKRMEYPMQTGSGTFSLLPGAVYLGQILPWSWGGQVLSTVRLGRNEHEYRLGDRLESRLWLARQLTTLVSVSAGTSAESWGNIRGADSALDASDEPTKDSARQGGNRLNALLGVTFHPERGVFKGQQFLIEGHALFMQSLHGPQLKQRYDLRETGFAALRCTCASAHAACPLRRS